MKEADVNFFSVKIYHVFFPYDCTQSGDQWQAYNENLGLVFIYFA